MTASERIFGRKVALCEARGSLEQTHRYHAAIAKCPKYETVKLAKHFVYSVDDCLRLVQLNLVA
jgi:hypothetical protein